MNQDVKNFIARFDRRLQVALSVIARANPHLVGEPGSPSECDGFEEDVQLLMRLAAGHPLRPEDEARLKERGSHD